MDLQELHSALIIWGAFGVATLFATPLEWYDWAFHGPRWRRWMFIFIAGWIVWFLLGVVHLAERFVIIKGDE